MVPFFNDGIWKLEALSVRDFANDKETRYDMFLSKTPISRCYCQMMGQTLKDEIRITQYNNPTKAGKY